MLSSELCTKAMQCLVDNGVDEDDAPIVLQALGYILLDEELEDVIDWNFKAVKGEDGEKQRLHFIPR